MDQRADNACGSHGFTENGEAIFDYTCDDCMLPWNHYDPPNNEEGTETGEKFAQTDEPPF